MKTTFVSSLILPLMTVWMLSSSAEVASNIEDLHNPNLAPFYHGVASGDPLPDGVILWTRVTRKQNDDDRISVEWTVAMDPELGDIVASGNALAIEERDFTVKVDVRGLDPGQTYYYGFKALGRDSLTGKTKTAPNAAVDQLKFAVVSCANYEWGYFSGYRRIAERADLDAVVHVGDYIYEYPDNDSYSSEEIRDERVLFPSGETVKLKHYRKRYATYRLDPNLRRAHQQHPFIVIWDDHEIANDAWRGGAENHQPKAEGPWKVRKAAAKRAFLEWMPIREDGDQIYRTLSYGPLMDLILVDTRLEGRDKQIDDVTNPRLYDDERTMLGGPQKDWLKTQLANSDATWKIIANQVIFSEFNVGFAADFNPFISPDTVESLFLDIWDGYPAERHELVNFIARKGIENAVILTGDIHASFAFEVADPASDNDSYDPETGEGAVAVEFVTPSLSAANFDEEAGGFFTDEFESDINSPDEDTGINPNPHMKFADLDRHGYVVLSVAADQVQADYYYLKNILRPRTTEVWGAGFINAVGTHHLVPADAPAPSKAVLDTPAP